MSSEGEREVCIHWKKTFDQKMLMHESSMSMFEVINHGQESITMLLIANRLLVVRAKIVHSLDVYVVVKPQGVMHKALHKIHLPVIMKLWSGDIFVNRFEKLGELIRKFLEVMAIPCKSEGFEFGSKDFLKSALVWKDQLAKCNRNICSIIEKANLRANLMSDAAMETLGAGFHSENCKRYESCRWHCWCQMHTLWFLDVPIWPWQYCEPE